MNTLTRFRTLNLLKSPALNRVQNATQSASETRDLDASITSESTLKYFVPSFTCAMENCKLFNRYSETFAKTQPGCCLRRRRRRRRRNASSSSKKKVY
jgi:hypothetical protein